MSSKSLLINFSDAENACEVLKNHLNNNLDKFNGNKSNTSKELIAQLESLKQFKCSDECNEKSNKIIDHIIKIHQLIKSTENSIVC